MMTASLVLEVLYQLSCVGEILRWFPGRLVSRITFPQYKVLRLAVEGTSIEDFLDLVFSVWCIYHNRRGWNLFSVLKGVLVVSLEKGYMKDRVDSHILGKVESVGSC